MIETNFSRYVMKQMSNQKVRNPDMEQRKNLKELQNYFYQKLRNNRE